VQIFSKNARIIHNPPLTARALNVRVIPARNNYELQIHRSSDYNQGAKTKYHNVELQKFVNWTWLASAWNNFTAIIRPSRVRLWQHDAAWWSAITGSECM